MKKQINLAVITSIICFITSLTEVNAQPYWDVANPGIPPDGIGTINNCMVAGGGALYCITSANNNNKLYRWRINDTPQWQLLASFGNVSCLALNGNFLYVGGTFSGVFTNGNQFAPATNIAMLDLTSGTWSDLGNGLPAGVEPLSIVADANNNVYATFAPGSTWEIGATNTDAFLKFDGTHWATVGGGLVNGEQPQMVGMHGCYNGIYPRNNDGILEFVLATDGTNIFLAGDFLAGVNTNGSVIYSPSIIKWDGTNFQPMGQGIYNPCCAMTVYWIDSIVVSGTNVFITGSFSGQGVTYVMDPPCGSGEPATTLARFSTSGSYIPTVRLLNYSIVEDQDILRSGGHSHLATLNGIVYVAGDFNMVENSTDYYAIDYPPNPANSIMVNGIAQWDGSNWTGLGAGLQNSDGSPGAGWEITADSNVVYVAGGFYLAGGLPATNGSLVRWVIPAPIVVVVNLNLDSVNHVLSWDWNGQGTQLVWWEMQRLYSEYPTETWIRTCLYYHTVTSISSIGLDGIYRIRGVDGSLNPVTPWSEIQAFQDYPTISITSPHNGSYGAPANFTVNANVSYSGSGAVVRFYKNGAIWATFTGPPYTFNWSNVPAGNYYLAATVTYANGWTTTSSGVSLRIR